MKRWLAGFLLFCFALMAVALPVQAASIPPKPSSSIYVQDLAGVMQPASKERLQKLGASLAAKTKAQVVVLTVRSLEGAEPEDYALEVLRTWGLGDKQLNNGVLILVVVEDKVSRVEVGYGLEGALPDAKTGQLQDEYMVPYFQSGDYDQGIVNGYRAVVQEVAKEYKLELKSSPQSATAKAQADSYPWDGWPWWAKILGAAALVGLLILDWTVFGGTFTYLILSLLRLRGGGGGGGGYGGGSGGGGGSSRRW